MWQGKLFLSILFFALIVLAISDAAIAAPYHELSDWKLPLPVGEYIVLQGDQDSCITTHCRNYAWGNQNTYCAIDIGPSNIEGTPVLAPADGTVIEVGYQASGGGHYVYILHEDGLVSHYEHLQKVYVTKGTLLKQGEPFGRVGKSGGDWVPHLHFTVRNGRNAPCLKITSLDGNVDFRTNAKIRSSNVQKGDLPDERVEPIPPTAPVTSTPPSGGPDPWDVSWLPADRQQVVAVINAIITSPETGGSPNAGLKGFGETILKYSLTSIEGNPAGVNPAFALAMFRKEANFATYGAAAANNNPGNIICAGGTVPLYGAIRCNGRFGVYASMEDGIKAYFWLLQYEYKPGGGRSHNCRDIPCIISHYAPSSENDTRQYIEQVTAWTRDFQDRILRGGTLPPSGTPGKPILVEPNNGSILPKDTDVTLRWNNADNATQYKVELWGGPYDRMTPCNWQSATSCHIGTMWPGTMYWHVKARNANGQESEWSETWSFTIQEPPPTSPPVPERPTLASPANGSSWTQNTDITLVWNPAANATQYKVELWGGPYDRMTPCNWQSATSCHIGTMWPGTMYWRVKARNANGQESEWSETWSFTIQESSQTPGYIELVEDLSLRTPSGNWPPRRGDKLIAHIHIRNGGDQRLHIQYIGVRGRRGSEFWDIGFWAIDLDGHQEWTFDPNNERPLEPGYYSFRISYSLDGSTWKEIGSEINFTVP